MKLPSLFKARTEPLPQPSPGKRRQRVFSWSKGNMFERAYDAVKAGNLWSARLMTGSADQELANALTRLRERSRHLASNNAHMQRYLAILGDNVIGDKGFRIHCDIRNLPSKNNAEGSPDTIANGIIEEAFAEWSRKGNCTVDGRMSWSEAQHMVMQSLARDGEVFIHLVRGKKYINGLALQFIEPDLIDVSKMQSLHKGVKIRMGVEMSANNLPLAYHVKTGTDDAHSEAETQRIPAKDMIHLYVPKRPSQSRGEPFMSPVIESIDMLNGYREAELVAARMNACSSMAITTDNPDSLADDEINDQEIMFGDPGTTFKLNPGESVQMLDPTHPNQNFREFEVAILHSVAAGLNIPYASLSGDLSSVNYSSTQFGAAESRDYYKRLQHFLIESLCEPVFREWLRMGITSGSLNLPISKINKFTSGTKFIGRVWRHIDPSKEVSALVNGMESNIIPLSDIAAQSGRTLSEHVSEIKRGTEALAAAGMMSPAREEQAHE